MKFYPKGHTYFEGDQQYLCVSDWVKQYTKPFPKEEVAKRIAKRDDLQVEDILNKWSLKANYATAYGNSIHKAIEYWIKYQEIPDHAHLKKVIKEFRKVITCKNLFSEIILHDPERKIAGTADVIEALGNKWIDISDIKTNGNIYKKGYNKLLPPFQDLTDSPLDKYRLQLSMYKHLAEVQGFKVRKLKIPYWSGTKFEIIPINPIKLWVSIQQKISVEKKQ